MVATGWGLVLATPANASDSRFSLHAVSRVTPIPYMCDICAIFAVNKEQ